MIHGVFGFFTCPGAKLVNHHHVQKGSVILPLYRPKQKANIRIIFV